MYNIKVQDLINFKLYIYIYMEGGREREFYSVMSSLHVLRGPVKILLLFSVF